MFNIGFFYQYRLNNIPDTNMNPFHIDVYLKVQGCLKNAKATEFFVNFAK